MSNTHVYNESIAIPRSDLGIAFFVYNIRFS